jgi:hypothetical protein
MRFISLVTALTVSVAVVATPAFAQRWPPGWLVQSTDNKVQTEPAAASMAKQAPKGAASSDAAKSAKVEVAMRSTQVDLKNSAKKRATAIAATER